MLAFARTFGYKCDIWAPRHLRNRQTTEKRSSRTGGRPGSACQSGAASRNAPAKPSVAAASQPAVPPAGPHFHVFEPASIYLNREPSISLSGDFLIQPSFASVPGGSYPIFDMSATTAASGPLMKVPTLLAPASDLDSAFQPLPRLPSTKGSGGGWYVPELTLDADDGVRSQVKHALALADSLWSTTSSFWRAALTSGDAALSAEVRHVILGKLSVLQHLSSSNAMTLPVSEWTRMRQSDPGPAFGQGHHGLSKPFPSGGERNGMPCPLIQLLWDWSMFLCTDFTLCPTPRTSASDLGTGADSDAGVKHPGDSSPSGTMTTVHSLISAIGQLELTLNTSRVTTHSHYARVAVLIQQHLRPVITKWLGELWEMIWKMGISGGSGSPRFPPSESSAFGNLPTALSGGFLPSALSGGFLPTVLSGGFLPTALS